MLTLTKTRDGIRQDRRSAAKFLAWYLIGIVGGLSFFGVLGQATPFLIFGTVALLGLVVALGHWLSLSDRSRPFQLTFHRAQDAILRNGRGVAALSSVHYVELREQAGTAAAPVPFFLGAQVADGWLEIDGARPKEELRALGEILVQFTGRPLHFQRVYVDLDLG